jgi:hypothetical protein
MKQLTGLTPAITDQRDAFDVLEGLPAKSENIGEALLPFVPDVYYEGAIGWIGHAFNVNEIPDPETGEPTGEAVIYVPDELAAEYPDGTVVELPDGSLVTIDLSAAIDVQTQGGAPMQMLTSFNGTPVWVRAVRVALVREDTDEGGTQIYFPSGEDPQHVIEQFADVLAILQPETLIGLLVLTAEEGSIAINPRFVLSVGEGFDGGARVTMSGGRVFDVEQEMPDVVSALNLV